MRGGRGRTEEAGEEGEGLGVWGWGLGRKIFFMGRVKGGWGGESEGMGGANVERGGGGDDLV